MRNRLLKQSMFCYSLIIFSGLPSYAQWNPKAPTDSTLSVPVTSGVEPSIAEIISDVSKEPASMISGSGGSLPALIPFKESIVEPNAKLQTAVDAQIPPLIVALNNAAMISATQLTEIQALSKAYIVSKNACASAADTAEMLCIESKSPQAILAKGIIDAAGPVLAAISSAQKTCSETASVTGLAQKAMTLAKGACVGSKLICDSSCSKAAAELKTISAKSTLFLSKAQAEYNLKIGSCTGAPTPICAALLTVQTTLTSFQSTVPQAFAAETLPQPTGTTGSLVLRCQGYSKDIVLFAMNVLGLLTASKSATECANKLASGPTSPTQVEYCNLPANSATSFCKCHKDNAAEGCPGHLAAVSTSSKSSDGKGNDIKSSGNGNQFAGGFDKIKVSPIDLGGLKSDTTNSNLDDKKANDALGAIASGEPGASSSGGGSSGSGAGKTSDSKEAVAGDDKKKSGLGSFFGMGSGSSSGSVSGKSGSGALGQKNMDAIQRQIASEKLRAEVSGSSGKSNWEKVSERYLRNKSTLLVGQ